MILRDNRSFFWILSFIILFNISCKNRTGSEPVDKDSFDLEQIFERGKIIAVTDFNSTNYFIYRGTPMGYQYELLYLLAEHLGLKLEILVNNDLEDNFEYLLNEKCDIIAVNLTVLSERSNYLQFTEPHSQSRQVLIQRKPENWESISYYKAEEQMIRNQLELAGKTIHVQNNSSYAARLRNLSDEIGDSIIIIEVPDIEAEQLITMVASGEIDYTVCDENVALVNKTYYSNIDVHTAVSFPQNLAWAVRKGSEELLDTVNNWLREFKKSLHFRIIYDKYFKNTRSTKIVSSDYYAITSGKVSLYDEYIKEYSELIDWDWRLLASLIYQESGFKPDAKSWAGAFGLMQLMPSTASSYGISSSSPPHEHIRAGVNVIKWLDENLQDQIKKREERIKFIMASYNVGLGHIMDARQLAKKNGKDPNVWQDNVDIFLLNKSKPSYYLDPVVQYGYCRGTEPYNFVYEILERYEHYKNILKQD